MKTSHIITIVSLLILLPLAIVIGCAEPVPETVAFPDKNLEKVIRDALDKPAEEAITPEELTGLTVLYAPQQNITDLFGIEYCTNLAELDLAYNQINDLSPLASLSSLTLLQLQFNQISDISPLASLTKLVRLEIHNNQISDISPLVENSGLSGNLQLVGNNLDLSEGSEDMENIIILEERGVRVQY